MYSVGVNPVERLNTLEKYFVSEKPVLLEIMETLISVCRMRACALSMRA
jgi:hypothetical protein